jgi:predicted nucleic acid-binding protein
VSLFVDSSVWFSAAARRDRDNERAKGILRTTPSVEQVTTDHVLVETWLLLNSRYRRDVADHFWQQLQQAGVRIELVTAADLRAAWAIGVTFPDQAFSIVDRTSFAVMERLGIVRVASFDNDFSIYRYGARRDRSFEVIRSGHSGLFQLFHRAILNQHKITCLYKGHNREFSPHILGHTGGREVALVYQFGGGSSRKLPTKGEWCCIYLSEIEDAKIQGGRWHTGSSHRKSQRCVASVYVDVNISVPNQPGRR